MRIPINTEVNKHIVWTRMGEEAGSNFGSNFMFIGIRGLTKYPVPQWARIAPMCQVCLQCSSTANRLLNRLPTIVTPESSHPQFTMEFTLLSPQNLLHSQHPANTPLSLD
jgi:hypothetical protein